MNKFIVLMFILILIFFLWIWYELSIPGSGDLEDRNNDLVNIVEPL